jgi:TolA-binding protein
MRDPGTFCLALSAILLLPGCGPTPSSTTDSNAKISNATEKIKDAAEATTEAAKAKRDDYVREMSHRLDELDLKHEELKDRAAKAEGQARIDLEKKLEEARAKREAAARKLDELKEAGAERWEKVKDGVGDALEDLKKAFE